MYDNVHSANLIAEVRWRISNSIADYLRSPTDDLPKTDRKIAMRSVARSGKCDLSYSSAFVVVSRLSWEALQMNSTHEVVAMAELGDLGKGTMLPDVTAIARVVVEMPKIVFAVWIAMHKRLENDFYEFAEFDPRLWEKEILLWLPH